MNDKELIEKIKDAEVHHRLRAMGAILHMAGLQNKVMQDKVVSKIAWYEVDGIETALFDEMEEHVKRLDTYIYNAPDRNEIIKECIHIANYATMIVDLMESSPE